MDAPHGCGVTQSAPLEGGRDDDFIISVRRSILGWDRRLKQSARVVGRENEGGAVLDVEHDVITAGAGVDADIWLLFDHRNPAQICTMTKGR